METRLHPLYKEAAMQISKREKLFFSDNELAEMLDCDMMSQDFQFAKLQLVNELLYTFDIDFIRSENEDEGKGYKIASNDEKVAVTTKRLQKKIYSTARKQRKVLSTVDRNLLSNETLCKVYDTATIRGGLLLSFFSQASRKLLTTDTIVRIDRPKLIEK